MMTSSLISWVPDGCLWGFCVMIIVLIVAFHQYKQPTFQTAPVLRIKALPLQCHSQSHYALSTARAQCPWYHIILLYDIIVSYIFLCSDTFCLSQYLLETEPTVSCIYGQDSTFLSLQALKYCTMNLFASLEIFDNEARGRTIASGGFCILKAFVHWLVKAKTILWICF